MEPAGQGSPPRMQEDREGAGAEARVVVKREREESMKRLKDCMVWVFGLNYSFQGESYRDLWESQ